MDWSNETYVRLYVKDTLTWKRLRWQGQTVLMHLIRKLDRAGTLDGVQDLNLDVSIITGLPEEVVDAGVKSLLKENVFLHKSDVLIMPNFIEAQEAVKSDRQRQRESRERKRTAVMAGGSQNVTKSHDRSRSVTDGHAASRCVTLNSALPCLTEHSLTKEDTPKPPKGADTRFDAFWNAYDKKIGKDYALKCFRKAVKSGLPDSDTLVAIICAQKEQRAKLEVSGAFVAPWPNPSTWLNQGRWKDELPKVDTVKSHPSAQSGEAAAIQRLLDGV